MSDFLTTDQKFLDKITDQTLAPPDPEITSSVPKRRQTKSNILKYEVNMLSNQTGLKVASQLVRQNM